MGCSASKGKLTAKVESFKAQKALLDAAAKNSADLKPVEENRCIKTDEGETELPLPTREEAPRVVEWSQMAHGTATAQRPVGIKETEANVMPQETGSEVIQVRKVEKRKRSKGVEKRTQTEKQGKSSIIQTKMDPPPQMVRAHQAAYAYLNPNISKYETLLGLLDQAAQTQLSLQTMMSDLVLRFEEINQALEGMAEEGELMLKEHGDYMAWPSGMTGPHVMPAKHNTDNTGVGDPPLDLLQQLLQHSKEKMRSVGSSVQGLGDTTLEEAVEYFASLSKVLAERLNVKHAAERRLAQVMARVEEAAMVKSNAEDSALHSEDSGIGGENESLTGSERHRRHRGSAGSASCGSGGTIRAALDTPLSNLPNQVGLDEGEDEEEDDDEDDGEDESDRPGRKRSNSSPPDPSQPRLHMGERYEPKRPLTAAAKPEHSTSTGYETILLELQKSQRDLDRQMNKMGKRWGDRESAGPQSNRCRAALRQHSLTETARSGQKGPLKTPCSLPALAPHPPGRHCVRRLINSFSQGVDGRPGQGLANIPPHIRRPRRSGTLLLPEIGNGGEGALVINDNNNNNSWPDGRDDLDVDSLPPPPPEVLMDNSFQSTKDMTGDGGEAREDSNRGRPAINPKTSVAQRLRASLQNVTVLPNRASVKQRSIGAMMGTQPGQDAEQQPECELDPEKEKATILYQQARKIIHLCNAAETPLKRNQSEQGRRGTSPLQTGGDNEAETSPCSPPVTAPPVSRVRLPPSCPSVHHRFPSPPAFRPEPTSKPSSRPSSPRTRAKRNSTEEIVPSLSFCDARSVFCQNGTQNSRSSSPLLPRPWLEPSRGRLPPTQGTETSTRCTQSELRPTLHSKVPQDGGTTSAQAKCSDPVGVTITERPASPPRPEDDTQSDPSATAATA